MMQEQPQAAPRPKPAPAMIGRAWTPPSGALLDLDRAERTFLLYRLADLARTAESILHTPHPGKMTCPWPRHEIIERTAGIVSALRSEREVRVYGLLGALIFANGVERNEYFSRMPDGDPRLCAAAIRRADQVCHKVRRATGLKVALTPLGEGRARRPSNKGVMPAQPVPAPVAPPGDRVGQVPAGGQLAAALADLARDMGRPVLTVVEPIAAEVAPLDALPAAAEGEAVVVERFTRVGLSRPEIPQDSRLVARRRQPLQAARLKGSRAAMPWS